MLERLKVREKELSELKDSLEQQLSTVRQKLQDTVHRLEHDTELSTISYDSDNQSNWSLASSWRTEFTPERSSVSGRSSPARSDGTQESVIDVDENEENNAEVVGGGHAEAGDQNGVISVSVTGPYGMMLRRTRTVNGHTTTRVQTMSSRHGQMTAHAEVITGRTVSGTAHSETSSSGIASAEGDSSPQSLVEGSARAYHTGHGSSNRDTDSGHQSVERHWVTSPSGTPVYPASDISSIMSNNDTPLVSPASHLDSPVEILESDKESTQNNASNNEQSDWENGEGSSNVSVSSGPSNDKSDTRPRISGRYLRTRK